jgi:hypothetical protein
MIVIGSDTVEDALWNITSSNVARMNSEWMSLSFTSRHFVSDAYVFQKKEFEIYPKTANIASHHHGDLANNNEHKDNEHNDQVYRQQQQQKQK